MTRCQGHLSGIRFSRLGLVHFFRVSALGSKMVRLLEWCHKGDTLILSASQASCCDGKPFGFYLIGVFAQVLLFLPQSPLVSCFSLEANRLGGDSFVCLIGEGSSGCSSATSSWLVGQDTP